MQCFKTGYGYHGNSLIPCILICSWCFKLLSPSPLYEHIMLLKNIFLDIKNPHTHTFRKEKRESQRGGLSYQEHFHFIFFIKLCAKKDVGREKIWRNKLCLYVKTPNTTYHLPEHTHAVDNVILFRFRLLAIFLHINYIHVTEMNIHCSK